jgi:hypothetical protein
MAPQRTSRQSPEPSPARLLAVFALVMTAIVVVIVIAASGSDDGDDPNRSQPARAAEQAEPKQAYYVIEPDDTFTGIAEEVGLTQTELERLNPNLDTQILPVQGCVNLVPDGCKELAGG